jgi:hypothetical protein
MSFVAVAVAGSAAAGLIGAKMASGAAKDAAKTQTDAAAYAAELQKAASDAALAEQKRQFNINQANLQPWLKAGTQGLAALQYGLGMPGADIDMTQGADGTYSAATLNPLDPLRSGDPQKLAELQQTLSDLPQRISETEARLAELRGHTINGHGLLPTFLGNTIQSAEAKMLEKRLADLKAQSAGIPKEIAGMYGMTPEQYQQALAQQNPAQTTPADGSAPEGTFAGTGMEYGELMQKFDPSSVQTDPGFDFRLNKGLQALERAGAAKGSGIGGGALKAITEYAQDYSSGEYDKAYARQFNTFQADQANRYNKLASLAGIGQTAANQIGTAGQSYANNVGQIGMNTAASLGDLAAQAANARASAGVASSNAWGSALGGISGNIMDLILLKNAGLLGAKSSAGGVI